MPKLTYVDKRFSPATLGVIEQAEAICVEFVAQGFTLTLRQLYYQFVARGLLPNRQSEYKRLGELVSDARQAGLIDWAHLEDRTRFVRSLPAWRSPGEIARSAAWGYHRSRWESQQWWPEVWIEKDALVGVIERVCARLDVPYFSCRGYVSQSEMWRAGRRLLGKRQTPIVFHLGDHDPSGVQMTEDIEARLALFASPRQPEVRRLALTMAQVDQYNPPPNPAKLTDSRAGAYVAEYGDDSWELDALEPRVLSDLIRENVEALIDWELWGSVERQEGRDKAALEAVADNWERVEEYLGEAGLLPGGE